MKSSPRYMNLGKCEVLEVGEIETAIWERELVEVWENEILGKCSPLVQVQGPDCRQETEQRRRK